MIHLIMSMITGAPQYEIEMEAAENCLSKMDFCGCEPCGIRAFTAGIDWLREQIKNETPYSKTNTFGKEEK